MAQKSGVIKSLIWKSSERILVQGLGLFVQIILARLLMPDDFACIAIISAIVNYLGLFVQSGLSVAIVQKKNLNDEDINTLTSISLLSALVIYVGLFFLAPAISRYYNVGDLVWPIRILGLTLFLFSFNSIQTGLLQRKMMFRTVFLRSLFATPLSGILGIAMAYAGFGLWSLIAYSLSNIFFIVIFMNMMPALRLRLGFSIKSAKEMYSFSGKILLTNMVSAGGDTIRTMTIGKVFKPDALAYYDRAYAYSSLVTQVVNTSISSVLLPVLSRAQEDISHLKNISRRSVSMSAFVMIPILSFVALIAKPLVLIVLSEKWLPCAPFLSLFCILRIPGVITSVDKQAYYALGRGGIALVYEIFLLMFNIIMLFALIPYGVFAIAVGYTMVEFLGNFVLCIISRNVYNYTLKERFTDLLKPVLATLIMVLCGVLLEKTGLSMWMKLIAQLLVCPIMYMLMQYVFKDKNLQFIVDKISMK